MNWRQEPEFLTREIVDAIHESQIDAFGGLHGIRDTNALESAIAAPQNICHYAYHSAESQACFDGNKRTGVQAALVFLEGCGIDASGLPEQQTYELMIRIASHEAGRGDLADFLHSELDRRESVF